MFAFIILIYSLMIFMDFIPITHQKNKKVIWIYVSLFAVAFTLSLLIEKGVPIPSPAQPLKQIVTKLVGL